MSKLRLSLYGIILALSCSTFSYAQISAFTNCDAIGVKTDYSLIPSGQPTEVAVGLQLINVTAIEDTSQTINVDFMVTQEWTDQRMAALEGCKYSLDEVWTPQIDVVNTGRLFKHFQKSVEVLGNSRLRQVQRYSGALVFGYDGHRFPFDTQDIVITLLNEEYDQDTIVITIDESVTGRNPAEFDIPDWFISDVNALIATKHFEILDRNHSAFEFHIPAERRFGYFISKVIVPLMLIVFMSWTVFWISPSQVGPQISMSATSMLTLIAFQFAMGSMLPRLSYFTIMDRFLVGSTFLVFLALIESITTNYLVNTDKENLALKVDRHCRWIFPIIFLVFVFAVFIL